MVVQQFGDYGGEYILLTLDAAGVLIDELVVAQNILTKEQNVIIESKLENHRISQTITADVFSGGIETISRTYSISDEGKIIFVD